MTITWGIQPTSVVTMVMKMLHNSCNMCTLDLTDMYTLAFGPAACVPIHTYTYQTKSFVHMLQL